MMKYKIRVVEELSRIIEIEADTEDEAFDQVYDMYADEEIVLWWDDFDWVVYRLEE